MKTRIEIQLKKNRSTLSIKEFIKWSKKSKLSIFLFFAVLLSAMWLTGMFLDYKVNSQLHFTQATMYISMVLLILSVYILLQFVLFKISNIFSIATKDSSTINKKECLIDDNYTDQYLLAKKLYPQLFLYIENNLQTLSNVINLDLLCKNILNLAFSKKTKLDLIPLESESEKIIDKSIQTENDEELTLTTLDLQHLGWNIWYLLDKKIKQEKVVSWLQVIFPYSLKNSGHRTLVAKLKNTDNPYYIEILKTTRKK